MGDEGERGRGPGAGLTALSLPDLRSLLRALERGELAVPVTTAGLSAAGFGAQARELGGLLSGLGREGVRAVLETAIAERVHRPPPHLDLVWTGPEAKSSVARDTAIVVRELFAEAQTSVLVGGFSFDHGEDIFRPLHRVMVERGVAATFFLDIRGHAHQPGKAEAYATSQIDQFFHDNWPFGAPRPEVWYDPRTAVAGPPWVSLHAKCVIVDERTTLVTSANFTDRGQTRNIEAGVRIEDAELGRKLSGQWRGLIAAGHVRRYRG